MEVGFLINGAGAIEYTNEEGTKKLDLYFISYTEIGSELIISQNIKSKTIKLLEESKVVSS